MADEAQKKFDIMNVLTLGVKDHKGMNALEAAAAATVLLATGSGLGSVIARDRQIKGKKPFLGIWG